MWFCLGLAFATLNLNFLLFSSSAFALINGHEDLEHTAVVQIEMRPVLLPPATPLRCSATVVGLHPVTVVTAAHCIVLALQNPKERLAQNIWLLDVAAVSLTFDSTLEGKWDESAAGTKDAARDIAILQFPETVNEKLLLKPEDLFSVAPIAVRAHDTVEICGFGRSSIYNGFGNTTDYRKCGSNFAEFNDLLYNMAKIGVPGLQADLDTDPDFRKIEELWFVSPQIKNWSSDKRIFELLPWLHRSSDQMETLSSANAGDSGGPAFKTVDGRAHLLGVASEGIQLPKTPSDGLVPSSIPGRNKSKRVRLVLFSSYLRLSDPNLKDLFEQAKANGADILGIELLLNSSGM